MSREEAFKLSEARRIELRAERLRAESRVLIIPVGAAMVCAEFISLNTRNARISASSIDLNLFTFI